MQFTRLLLRDYGVYGGTTDVDLRPEPDRPVILFGGTNGAGKTTLFESILVCLYGEGCMRLIRTAAGGRSGGGGRREYERLLASRLHRGGGGSTAASASVTVRFAAFVGGEGVEYEVCRSWSGGGGRKPREQLSVGRRPLAGSAGDGRAFEPVDMSARWQSFITDLAPPAVAGLFFFDGERISGIARQYGGYAGDAFRSALGLDVVERLQADLVANAAREGEEEEEEEGADGQKGRKKRRGAGTKYAKLEAERAKHELERRRLADLLDQKGAGLAELRAEVSAAEQRAASFQGGDNPDARLMQAGLNKEDAERRILEACGLCETPLRLLPPDLLSGASDWLEGCWDGLSAGLESGALVAVRGRVEADAAITGRSRRRALEILDAEIASHGRASKDGGGAGRTTTTPPPPDTVSAARALRTLESAKGPDDRLQRLCSGLASQRTRITELEAARAISERGGSERQEAVRELAALASRLGSLQSDVRRLEADMRAAARAARSANSRMRDLLKLARRRGGSERKAELRARVLDALEAFHSRVQSARTRRLEDALLRNMRILMHKDGGIQRVEVDAENGFAIRLYGASAAEAEDVEDAGGPAGAEGAGVDPAAGLSEGERQVFALSVVWALAQVSGRPLPFVIDTPLARLDAHHRSAIAGEFLPSCSHQVIVLSTDSEIGRGEYRELAPRVARSYVLEYAGGRASCRPGYFWDPEEGEAA